MLNPSAIGNDTFDFLGGNISDFFADVDDAITMSECVKGQYRLNVQPAVNANDNIITPNFATVNLSAPGSLVVDLSNSFISLTAKVTINMNQVKGNAVNNAVDVFYFVGWKSSFEAIRQYEILVNGNVVYTQSFSAVESFIQDQVLTELVRNNSQFMNTTWENVMHLSPDICGTYVRFNRLANGVGRAWAADNTMDVEIPLKIPIERFLILKNLKYLLSWMGKWELRCFFDPASMVVMPVDPIYICQTHYNCATYIGNAAGVTRDFTQFGDSLTGILNITATNPGAAGSIVTVTAQANEIWTARKMICNTVETNLATFQLRADVVEELKAKYVERPLTFPVNFFLINRFAGMPNMAAGLSHILSTTVNNCDTLFLLVPNTTNSTTCFFNPYITNFQLDAGPYGTYPSQPMNTFNDRRFINMIADSLNVNNSVLTSFNKDTDSSFCIGIPQYNWMQLTESKLIVNNMSKPIHEVRVLNSL
jgi:hypothetical protein